MKLLCLALVTFFLTGCLKKQYEVPDLTGAVVDNARLLTRTDRGRLEGVLREIRRQGGPQIAILTVASLRGIPIEQASIQVVEKWQLGSKEKDDGLLIMIAKQDRKLRIEVGQGLEGEITDAFSKRVIDQVMVPLIRQGSFGDALLLSVYQITKKAAPNLNIEQMVEGQTSKRRWSRRSKKGLPDGWSVGVYILLMIFFALFSRGGFLGFLMGSAIGGGFGRRGGFGGGGFGGGGFGGGGGGFSGGGASGGW